MDKIETIFDRDENFVVIDKPRIGTEWVFRGEGVATEKIHGTNVRVTVKAGEGVLYEKRHNPDKFEKGQGVSPKYVLASREDPQDRHIFAALDNTSLDGWPDGAWPCEAVGPKIQGNALGLPKPVLYPFSFFPVVLIDIPRTYEGLKAYFPHSSYFSPLHQGKGMEGIVFHHSDGRMAKIKARDFIRRVPR